MAAVSSTSLFPVEVAKTDALDACLRVGRQLRKDKRRGAVSDMEALLSKCRALSEAVDGPDPKKVP